jgi:hypothetical protein
VHLQVKEYPGMTALDANGFPIAGKDIKARPLVQGDVIEVSPSMFSTTDSMQAKGDNGGIRYYSYEWVYVVGQGLKPWYGVQPRLNSVPLPAETLSGGIGSVGYNYSDNALFMFQQPHTNIGMQNMQRLLRAAACSTPTSPPATITNLAMTATMRPSACKVRASTSRRASPATSTMAAAWRRQR